MGRLLLPSWFNPWGWVAIIAAVTLIIVLLIIAIAWLLCKKYQKRRANAAVGKAPKRQPASPKNNTPTVREEAAPKRQQPAPAPVQPVRQAAPAQPVRQPAPAPA